MIVLEFFVSKFFSEPSRSISTTNRWCHESFLVTCDPSRCNNDTLCSSPSIHLNILMTDRTFCTFGTKFDIMLPISKWNNSIITETFTFAVFTSSFGIQSRNPYSLFWSSGFECFISYKKLSYLCPTRKIRTFYITPTSCPDT